MEKVGVLGKSILKNVKIKCPICLTEVSDTKDLPVINNGKTIDVYCKICWDRYQENPTPEELKCKRHPAEIVLSKLFSLEG
jgi:hypothetical protein